MISIKTLGFFLFSVLILGTNPVKKTKNMTVKTSIYENQIHSLSGDPIQMKSYEGKKLLIVNVASECGYTKQYADLQKLHETYKDQLVIIGVPCNQFGGQEPGNHLEIQFFCEKNFGITFTLTEKIDVKGANQHPLYAWLTEKEKNGKMDSTVKWNFQKYLIDEKGNLIDVFYSATNPMSDDITKYLK
jgi:glutathione peroxidase